MADLVQIGSSGGCAVPAAGASAGGSRRAYVLQAVTLLWMTVELGVSMYAAVSAHSTVLFAFGADSLVEVLSAVAVVLQWTPRFLIPERRAARIASVLLFALAVVVAALAVASLVLGVHAEVSRAGIGITAAALVAMPILARLKRAEGRRRGNAALVADAAQTATCAYLALTALAGICVNAWFHLPWFDSVAAMAAVPFLVREGRSAWQGNTCACC